MALHKAQAQFARAQWRIKLLAPIWASQLLLTLTMMGLFASRFGKSMHHHDEKVKAGKHPTIEYAWEVTNIAMSLIASLCTLAEVARYYTESLTPWTMLFTHVIKAACAFAILSLDVTVYIVLSEEKYSLVGIGLDALLIILTGAMLTYAGLAYRRLSRYDEYAHPANVQGYGFSDYSTSSKTAHISASSRDAVKSGRLSIVSMNEPLNLDELDSTPYHHQRDTQFEAYMAKRNSFQSAYGNLESGAGGSRRNSGPPQAPLSPLGGSPEGLSTQYRSPVAPVATGQVGTLQRVPTKSRVTSWASDHVLLAVPEEDGKMDHEMTDDASLLSPESHEMPGFDGSRLQQEADIPEPRRK